MKRLVVTGISSMQACDEGALLYARPSRIRSTALFAQTASELAAFPLPSGCTTPVSVMVPSDNNRLRTCQWQASRRTEPLPPRSLLDLGDGRYLTSPSYFFLKVAPRLTVVQAVLLGMELCGYYSTLMSVPYRDYRARLLASRKHDALAIAWPPSSWDMSIEHQRDLVDNGFVSRNPLVSTEDLAAYLSQALSRKSNAPALKAARLLQNGSRSPMESRLYARYCLPRRYGGMNLRPVELNSVIRIPESYASASYIREYSVDLYWSKAGLAIEYQGSFAHSGATAEQKDRLKRNILEATGVRIISIDKKQYANEDMLELYGLEIAKGLGIFPSQLKARSSERAARFELIEQIGDWGFDLYRHKRQGSKGRGWLPPRNGAEFTQKQG